MQSRAQKNVRVFWACGGVLEHGVVLLHKPVPKVRTHVLQPVHDQADAMKYVFIFWHDIRRLKASKHMILLLLRMQIAVENTI